MGLSQRGYAKYRRCSPRAVQKALASGRIVALPDGTIDPSPPAAGATVLDHGTYHRTRLAKLAIEAQRAQVELERRRGTLISRDRAMFKAFAFARVIRDTLQAWPSRAGPGIAAEVGVEPAVLVIALDEAMRTLLEELANERVEF